MEYGAKSAAGLGRLRELLEELAGGVEFSLAAMEGQPPTVVPDHVTPDEDTLVEAVGSLRHVNPGLGARLDAAARHLAESLERYRRDLPARVTTTWTSPFPPTWAELVPEAEHVPGSVEAARALRADTRSAARRYRDAAILALRVLCPESEASTPSVAVTSPAPRTKYRRTDPKDADLRARRIS